MLAEQVYQDVREAITSSRYPPGALLVEKEIASKHGVSRGTAREALQRLSAEGHLTNLPRKGYQVSLLTRDDIGKIQRLRLTVESLSLSVVIAEATDEQIRAFFPLLQTPPGEGGEYTTMNARFHLELAKLTGDPFIVGTLRSLLGALSTTQFYHQMGAVYDGQEYHEGILTALLRRDPLAAVECLKKDLFR